MIVFTEAEQRKAVVEAARSWLGTPYHHQANVKGAGVDCAMILVEVYKDAGIHNAEDPRPYPDDWMLHHDHERYLKTLTPYAEEIKINEVQPGDFAIFKFGRTYSHSAIIADWPKVIHAYARDRLVVLGDITKMPFEGRAVKFFNPFAKV